MKKIDQLFYKIKNDTNECRIENGYGWCAYCSSKLSDALNENGISHQLIIGKVFKNTDEARHCISALHGTINSIDDKRSLEIYKDIKKAYLKRGKLPINIGHSVVLIESTVYDLTGAQFNLPEKYGLNVFLKIWQHIFRAEIKTNEQNIEDFKIENIELKTLT